MDSPALSRVPLTLKKAKALHRKRKGDELPEDERRRLNRGIELDRRAGELREQEERRKWAQKKKAEREQKEAQARDQLGIGLATQLVGYSHAKKSMKNAMEAFLGVKKKDIAKEPIAKPAPIEEPIRKAEGEDVAHIPEKSLVIGEQVAKPATPVIQKEPWDELDDEVLFTASPFPERIKKVDTPHRAKNNYVPKHGDANNPWDGDDLDDEAFLYIIINHSPSRDRRMLKRETPHGLSAPKPATNQSQEIKSTVQVPTNGGTKAASSAGPTSMSPSSICWDDFLESNTQISVQLDGSPTVTRKGHTDDFPIVLTQDLDFSTQDSVELGLSGKPAVRLHSPKTPSKPICINSEDLIPQKEFSKPKSTVDNDRNLMPPPPLPRPVAKKPMATKSTAMKADPHPLPSITSGTGNFHEFGLCTQDVQQLLDDDIFSDDDPKHTKPDEEPAKHAAALSFGSLSSDDEFG